MAALSKQHPKVKRLRRLVGRRSARAAESAFVLEGAKVLSEALDAGAPVEGIYVAEGTTHPVLDRAAALGIRVHDLAPGALEAVGGTVTPQPILAVAPLVAGDLQTLSAADFVVVCVDVRDPGNAGTVLRSAEAAGAGGVVLCEGSVDPHNPKTVRASAGTIFHVPVVAGGPPEEVLDVVGRWGLRRIGTSAHGGTAHTDADLRVPLALVLGNEAHGLPDTAAALLDAVVTVPMRGRAESLNVGMAAAIVCFEVARQRAAVPA